MPASHDHPLPGLRRVMNATLAVLLAPRCAACETVLDAPCDGPVCAACWAHVVPILPPVCDGCGDPLPSWRVLSVAQRRCPRCRRGPAAVGRARAAGEYDDTLRAIIHALKYDGRTSLARPLADLMRVAGQDVLSGVTCAVPVPLHRWRRWRRGFNQSAALARHLPVPTVHALRRLRGTRPQAGLSAAERRRNVHGGFALAWRMHWAPARTRWLEDRCVLLVDDVRTTGATLEACARVLQEAGVREVRALTAARAAPPRR